ncbi:porin [Thalassotalea ponticola]|uniref:porin n=1 Tax=Thalassotalea ponticola TaxID=1523392 RepID=UPI0025B340D7|nr:porin [Thalassotalea ponticola]MDN3652077.1 porin [Thalassotalea ponticola]
MPLAPSAKVALYASLLATYLSSSLYSTSHAVEIYKDNQTSVNTHGYLRVTYEDNAAGEAFTDSGSRWGFKVNRELAYGWQGRLVTEWAMTFERSRSFAVDFIGNDANVAIGDAGETISSRLGYIEFTHDDWGRIGLGKQWGVYYDIAGGTDLLHYYGGSALGVYKLGADGGLSGTGRAERAITWRKSYNNLNIGLLYQPQDEEIILNFPRCRDIEEDNPNFEQCNNLDGQSLGTIGTGYGISLSYQFDMIWLGATYNTSNVDGSNSLNDFGLSGEIDDTMQAFMIKYGTFNKGLYVAAGIAEGENHEIDNTGKYFDSRGVEVLIKYQFAERFWFYGGINHLESRDNTTQYEISYPYIAADYHFKNNVGAVFVEVRKNNHTNADGSDGNTHTDIAIGVQLNL